MAASWGVFGQQSEAPAEISETAPKYEISGQITDPEGLPLAGATVWVRPKDHNLAARYKLGDEWVAPVSIETADDGRFSIPLALAGPYVVFVIHPGHPPRSAPDYFDDGAKINFAFPEPLAYFGYVQDTAGKPVAGADVTACGRQAASFGGFACQRTRSASDGKYTFEMLAKDNYAFQAWAPGYALSAVERGRFPLEENTDNAPGPLELEPGVEVSGSVANDAGTLLANIQVHYASDRVRLRQARGQRDVVPLNPLFTDDEGQFNFRGLPAGEPFKLFANTSKNQPAESRTLTLEAGAVVGGVSIVYERPASVAVHLIDPDEQPIESLEVLWMPVKDGPQNPAAGFRMAGSTGQTRVESQGEGRFTITEIKPQRYDLTLLPGGHREIEIKGLRIPPGAEIDLGTRVAQRGATLSGYVLDDLGDPIQDAELEGMYLQESTAMSRSVRSEADGRFVLGGLADGPLLWLKVEADGHAPRNERSVASNQTDFEIVLERVGVVTGRVLLENGESPSDVEASLEAASGDRIARGRAGRTSAKGDDEGRFTIKDATPGTHYLRLTAKGAKPLRVKDVVVESGITTDVGTYRLEQGLELSGNVLDARDGSAVVHVAISADAAGGGLGGTVTNLGTTTTDDEGRFVLDGLEAGRLVVTAKHADYAPERVEAILEENEPLDEMTIELGQGGTLRGTVRNESGRPSPDRVIGLIEGGGFTPDDGAARTNESGEYRVERVRPGSYRLVLYPDASGDAMNIQQKSATIHAGQETVVDFDSESRIAFEGLLTRGGRPVGEVTVMLIPAGGGGMLQTRTASVDIAGRFAVGLSRAGDYNVIVQDLKQGLGALVGQTSIVVPDEPTVSQEITLQSGIILGSVLDSSGNPLEGAFVSAVLAGARAGEVGAGTAARAEADGSFRIEGANEGTYTLSAVADGYEVATRSVTLSGSATVDGVDFRLEPAGELHGRIIDEHGNGIPGAFVFASISGTPASSGIPAESDVQGFFRVSAPSEGPCDIEAVARGFAPGSVRGFLPSPDPETPGARITLTRGATIAIRIVDAAGDGVSGAQPTVLPERPSQAFTIGRLFSPTPPTDASGSARVTGLSPGSYKVSVAGHPEVAEQMVTLSGDGEIALTLQLP